MSRNRGFTLLEVMLAVSIAAIGIVSLLELFGGSMRLARVSSDQTRAVVLASSLMDQALWRAELPERDFSGEDGAYRWPDKPWLPLAFSLMATRQSTRGA